MSHRIWTVVTKEFSTYFTSPMAFIFLGTFSVVSLFVFFWVDKFFSRNIVDVRPLFEWMPILLIFLSAALTMKMWSEERRMGTLEFLLTMPVKIHHLVLGKFFACFGLVIIALILTLGIPITVSFMGNLDWGPVVGGYIASVLLAGAYISIGLYISSKSDNQIVSIILATVVCSIFYIIGSETLSSLLGNKWGELFRLAGTGSRFESIVRGVLDLRDVYYYTSITGVFLALNVLSLQSLKWSREGLKPGHRHWRVMTTLVIANFIAPNFWLYRTAVVRVDLTEERTYTISEATRNMIARLQEPLVIRGYFSAKTHPLLAPLVPQIRDTLREYAAVSGGKVRAEFIDPRENPELEEEANRRFNIRPMPFHITDKYQASVVNSYFNVLIQYGDKYEVLGFEDLIEIKPAGEMRLDVRLRNLEYDLTRGIKKVLYGFQGIDSLFESIKQPVEFQGFISAEEKLPKQIAKFKSELLGLLKELEISSNGKFQYKVSDPEADSGALAKKINQEYGFRPMVAGLFNPVKFYFYMIVQNGGTTLRVPFPKDLNREAVKRSIEAALKRFSPGFLKTVGFYVPMRRPQFFILRQKLTESFTVKDVDLKSGFVPEDVDLLLVAAPKNLNAKQIFAIDQFLMKGGSLILLTSPFFTMRDQNTFRAVKETSGLEPLLKQYGIAIEEKMVLDPQNEPYPVPVSRKFGGFAVREIQMVPYPYFVDVRGKGMNVENPITARLPQVTLSWSSPIDFSSSQGRPVKVTPLLKSSRRSWVSSSTNIQPNFKLYRRFGFAKEGDTKPYTLAAVIEGVFESYYKDKESPLLKDDRAAEESKGSQGEEGEGDRTSKEQKQIISGIIDKSPESARILLFASNEFLADQTLQIARVAGGERFINSLELIENAVDWSLEDPALLSIRGRGQFSRTLNPMTNAQRAFWEYLNYAVVIFGLVIVYVLHRAYQGHLRDHYRQMLEA
ncbi:MAG: Gldg family protein [Candidatus Binatia bacterium]